MSHMLLTPCMVFKHAVQEILLVLCYLATLATAPLPWRPYQTSALNLNLQKLSLEGAREDEDWFRLCLHLKGLSHTSKRGLCIQWLIRPKTEQFGGQRLQNDVRNGCRQDRREAGVLQEQKTHRAGAKASACWRQPERLSGDPVWAGQHTLRSHAHYG